MSEERLQEIKDSIEFQYTLAKAKGYDNALLFTNEEEELVEEIERLHSIIKEVREYCRNDDNFQIVDLYSQDIVDGIQEELLEILDKVERANNDK